MRYCESGGYKLEKVELDEETTSVTNDYKLTAATNDTVTIAASDSWLCGNSILSCWKKVFNLTTDQFGFLLHRAQGAEYLYC